MKIKNITIENFRSYEQASSIHISDFSTIVGRNDVGKSTFLEALDIFFNGVKMDQSDICVSNSDSPVVISIVFENLPSELILDVTSTTSLEEEYLLNDDGDLEIIKEYSGSSLKPITYVKASYFENEDPLFTINNGGLKKKLTSMNLKM